MTRLAWNGYGKAEVRLVKVDRNEAAHLLTDLSVDVQLQGNFESVHTGGDNACVLPTDTMKNTVYALARQGTVDPPEAFAERLGAHFLDACPAATRAVVTLKAHQWERLSVGGAAHRHAFARGSEERRIAVASVGRDRTVVEAGLEGLGLLKTTGSGFSGYLRDRYTTLPETEDRIFATEVTAQWRYGERPLDFAAAWCAVRRALIETFAEHQSASVQQTLYAMGEQALRACAEAAEIRLVLPNRHHLLVDLRPFGLENPNEVFVATREPYGRIEAVVTR
ncbi:MAG TPA: urate oxidase [Gemmatimonadales bacterium]